MNDSYKIYASKDYVDQKLSSKMVFATLLALDMVPVIINDEGAIMTDETSNILLV